MVPGDPTHGGGEGGVERRRTGPYIYIYNIYIYMYLFISFINHMIVYVEMIFD